MDEDTLLLAHIIFRHGNRTPELTYPNDPHKDVTFFPTGRGHLTTKGKENAYDLGQILRKRYDKFLGQRYTPEILDAWTTDADRTKMTLQTVLASLFQPVKDQQFHETLNWQPIPYKYIKVSDDDMLLSIVRSDTVKAYKEHLSSSECVSALEKHKETFKCLSEHTGSAIESPKDVMILFGVLKVEEEAGLTLPPWTADYWPKTIEALALKEFRISTATPKLRKLILGKLITKILDDTERKLEGKSACKMHLYSAHDVNIGTLLSFFDIPLQVYPTYCCFLSIEVHKIDGVYSVKLFYHDHSTPEPKATVFKSGLDFINYKEFKSICQEIYVEK